MNEYEDNQASIMFNNQDIVTGNKADNNTKKTELAELEKQILSKKALIEKLQIEQALLVAQYAAIASQPVMPKQELATGGIVNFDDIISMQKIGKCKISFGGKELKGMDLEQGEDDDIENTMVPEEIKYWDTIDVMFIPYCLKGESSASELEDENYTDTKIYGKSYTPKDTKIDDWMEY